MKVTQEHMKDYVKTTSQHFFYENEKTFKKIKYIEFNNVPYAIIIKFQDNLIKVDITYTEIVCHGGNSLDNLQERLFPKYESDSRKTIKGIKRFNESFDKFINYIESEFKETGNLPNINEQKTFITSALLSKIVA